MQSVLLASSPERNKNTITLQGPQAPYFTQPTFSLRMQPRKDEPPKGLAGRRLPQYNQACFVGGARSVFGDET